MAIDITMPALSPTMESGTLAAWHIKVGDTVRPGDVIAEIETDKATMEVEAVDEGVVRALLVEAGTENVAVNAVIAQLEGEGDENAPATAPDAATDAVAPDAAAPDAAPPAPAPKADRTEADAGAGRSSLAATPPPPRKAGERIIASPLARRIAQQEGVDLSALDGSGPRGRIVKADVLAAASAGAKPAGAAKPAAEAVMPKAATPETDVPHEAVKLSSMRKTIARRLTESKQTVPHYYLALDVSLDALLKLRAELNDALAPRGVKLSVNDLLVKALGLALIQVPDANVSFAGDHLKKFSRADVSVAVAIPGGLITPVIRDAAGKRLSDIAADMKDLAARARDGKLKPSEYQGGTASLSNLGMYGIRQFSAVINPPEGMIMAVGAGEKRPWVSGDDLVVATVMSATGSFDHRAIDGAVGAELMQAFKQLVENPLGMLA